MFSVPGIGTTSVPQPTLRHHSMWCEASPAHSLLFVLFLLSALAASVSVFVTLFYSSPPFLSCFWPLLTFVSHHSDLSLPVLHLSICLSLPSSPPRLSSSVPIRRNLIGNQSFWWKNGVGLSITVPWVLPAERGVQKRLYTGTVVGKVNAADSLSLALIPCLFIHSFSLRHTLYLSFSISRVRIPSRCLSISLKTPPPPENALSAHALFFSMTQ